MIRFRMLLLIVFSVGFGACGVDEYEFLECFDDCFSKECYEGNVWCYDDCENRDHKFQECLYGCEYGECISLPECGNGICGNDENCSSCSVDCGVCPKFCGDGNCDSPEENCGNCSDCECQVGYVCDGDGCKSESSYCSEICGSRQCGEYMSCDCGTCSKGFYCQNNGCVKCGVTDNRWCVGSSIFYFDSCGNQAALYMDCRKRCEQDLGMNYSRCEYDHEWDRHRCFCQKTYGDHGIVGEFDCTYASNAKACKSFGMGADFGVCAFPNEGKMAGQDYHCDAIECWQASDCNCGKNVFCPEGYDTHCSVNMCQYLSYF